MNRETARNEILSFFKTAWDAFHVYEGQILVLEDDQLIILETGEPLLVEVSQTRPLPVVWDNVKGTPDTVAIDGTSAPPAWARVTLQHVIRQQASLNGAESTKRYEARGLLIVSIFVGAGKGLLISDRLCKIVEDAFDGRKTSGGVWFQNARSNEIGQSGNWHQTNFVVDFIYDEVK